VIEVGVPFRARSPVLGAAALILALALVLLPAVLAIIDSDVLSPSRDAGWLGSPVTRFAVLQILGIVVPFALGMAAALMVVATMVLL
jgi:hypothetical protein